ncbi:hypothetical protein [Chryseobacterium arthrosphaerae]|uniref:Uncharacterized protein n=1 Tax=Chryseobacterium arthrosphaerae TaxID=651561 RepID=A0A1B8ZP97_9FLAO|nr:hypothetical protein [Chryseobacterium arthrosphaerae]OCA73418.1 hypothetical protein BBI00_03245 [Chryseobacterium arthrosphaerae]
MEIVTDLDTINEILRKADYDQAGIWLFDITHRKLAIKLYSNENEDVIYLVMGSCLYIKGNFSWKNPDLLVSMVFNIEHSENEYKIRDHKADFELIGNSRIALAKGLETEFGDSFEGFLKA